MRPPQLRPAPATPKDRQNQEASRLFQRFCATCHGPDGRGTRVREILPMIPDFTRREWQEARSDPQLVGSVLDGKGERMPSFGGKLAREQARELAAFIRTFAPSRVRPTSTATAEFETRIRELNLEFEDLQRQIRALSAPPQGTPSGPR
jgi:mono/diheme cytochrome c family protein